jgi:hypothetical protein
MAIWQDSDGKLHDDMNGSALSMSSWPQGMTLLTDAEVATVRATQAPTVDPAVAARTLRNSYLDQLQPLYVRHKSQLDLGGTTSLTSAQFTDLLTLMEALRNVPEQADCARVANAAGSLTCGAGLLGPCRYWWGNPDTGNQQGSGGVCVAWAPQAWMIYIIISAVHDSNFTGRTPLVFSINPFMGYTPK